MSGDLEGVRVAVPPRITVTGHVTVEGADLEGVTGAHVVLHVPESTRDTEVQKDGTFALTVYAGHFHVYIATENPRLVIRSIRSEGQDVYQSGIAIADGSKANLEIVLAPDGGRVEGTVLGSDDQPVVGATVVLAGAVRSRHDSFHSQATDQNGRFRFENVRPSDYKVFAWDDIEPNVWFDPDFLKDFEARGEAVTVSAGGRATAQLHSLR